MSVHQLADGRWIVQYRDPDRPGKQKREYFGRGLDAEREARERNAHLSLRSYEKRTPPPFEGPTLDDIAQAYMAAHAAVWEPTTSDMTLIKFTKRILAELGHLTATRVTPGRVDKYVETRLKSGVTRSTVRREIGLLMACLSWAADRNHIQDSPLRNYRKPQADDAIIAPPTADEIRRIVAQAPDHLNRAIRLLYYTGARPGRELYALTWGSVDPAGGNLRIVSAKKHGPKIRIIPIHEDLSAHLEDWRTHDQAALPPPLADRPLIHYRGRPVSSLKKSWKSALTAAGITRRVRLYDIRHAFATDLLDDGADLKAVSEILGHANPRTTLNVYQHTSAALHRATITRRKKI